MNRSASSESDPINQESSRSEFLSNTNTQSVEQIGRTEAILTYTSVGLALLFFAYELVVHYSIVDDAYISYRFLDNWLQGEGLVFNPGERVEGYTNLLWILLMAPLRLAGLNVELAATTLSIIMLASLLLAVFQTARNLSGNVIAGWTAVILATGSVHLARWTVSGMETILFAALIALANQQLSRNKKHALASSTLFGLSVLTRPPGVLQAVVAFGAALFQPGGNFRANFRRLVLPASIFLIFPLAQLGFRLAYYGLPLPNTAYVKLGGDLMSLLALGFDYLWRFLNTGGIVLLLPCLLAFLSPCVRRSWVALALAMQIASHIAYVIYVGGDFFEFGRFFVPVAPAIAVLGSLGLNEVFNRYLPSVTKWIPAAALSLSVIAMTIAHFSTEQKVYELKAAARIEREKLASWIDGAFPKDATIAINVAGLIPYRTQRYTIDMLGLNDRHIAQTQTQTRSDDGVVFVGHFKHDGDYVCSLRPDIVVTGGAELIPGRNFREASVHPALTSFPGDREFLRSPNCGNLYRPTGAKIVPGGYSVVYAPLATPSLEPNSQQLTAKQWFERGLELMNDATMTQAAMAFERSLELDPSHSVTKTNLAYCYLRLDRANEALDIFEDVLRSHPRQYDALYGLAMAHTKLHDVPEAIATWKRYIAEAPPSSWKGRAKKQLEKLMAK